MVVEQSQLTGTGVEPVGQSVEVTPTNASHEGLHFISLTSTHELARLSAPRQDADYTDTALITVEGVQMPVCAVRTLLDPESIQNLQTLSTQLRDSLGHDPNLQIVIAGPQLQYQGTEKPIMYPAHIMTSFEIELEVAEGQKARVNVLGPVCVSIAHQIMLDERYSFPERVRATEALLEDLRSAANGRYMYIAMPERNGPQRASTTVSLLDGTNLTIDSSPTHALMTHLAGQAKPLTVQVDRGEKGNKPYTLYPLPPAHATSFGQDALGKAEMQQKIQEVSAAIIQAWEGNFDRHEKGSDEGLGGVIGQEVVRVMKRFERLEIFAFLNAIDEEDAFYFKFTSNNLLRNLQEQTWPSQESLRIAQTLDETIAELCTIHNIQALSGETQRTLSTIPGAILDIVETHFRDYQTAARESEGLHVLSYSEAFGLVEGSSSETQRTYTVDMQRLIWQFLREHPALPVCGQILLDWVHTIQASDQSSNSTYTEYLERNRRFYEEYTKFMNANAGTVSEVDVERVASIIRFIQSSDSTYNPSVYVGGPGTMDRFEGPLLAKLKAEGIIPGHVVAVDALNFSADAQRHATALDIPIEFRQGNILYNTADQGEQFDVIIYPWSIWCDVMPRLDVIRGMQATARRTKLGGVVVVDQPLPLGESSYKQMRAEQAVEHGEEGTIGRSYKMGDEGPELWKDLNVIGLADLCLTAAQAGLVPINLPATVPELYAFMEGFERDEAEHIRASEEGQNTDAMSRPAYHTSGWNRVTIAFQNVGVEEALKRAHTGSSLLHELTRLRVSQPEDGLK